MHITERQNEVDKTGPEKIGVTIKKIAEEMKECVAKELRQIDKDNKTMKRSNR